MMCDPIVTGVAQRADGLTIDLDLPAGLACFAGHYPGFPVLPGVVQIDWVMRLAAVHWPDLPPVARTFRIKFRQVVGPGDPLSLTLHRDTARRRLDFTYRSRDAVTALGQVSLAPA
jgi:3-hydroxymyristoyl/3-hydroxydecanoyl-(acyl carrier protein) dehydratase